MATKSPEMPEWGSFALVAYIPDPLGSFLTSLRQTLPGSENPQAHLTILPPRLLRLAVESASSQAKKILEGFPPFTVEVGEVQMFAETSILYLDVAGGNIDIRKLHDVLNAGGLADNENFEFMPHITLGGPVMAELFEGVRLQAEKAWQSSACPRSFEVREVVCLWQPPKGSSEGWERLGAHPLGGSGDAGKAARAGFTQTS